MKFKLHRIEVLQAIGDGSLYGGSKFFSDAIGSMPYGKIEQECLSDILAPGIVFCIRRNEVTVQTLSFFPATVASVLAVHRSVCRFVAPHVLPPLPDRTRC